jgi:hypothetical protein
MRMANRHKFTRRVHARGDHQAVPPVYSGSGSPAAHEAIETHSVHHHVLGVVIGPARAPRMDRKPRATGPFANKTDSHHSEEHDAARANLSRAMANPHDARRLWHTRAEDERIKAEVGARSDGRAYGSGVEGQPRGHRPLGPHYDHGNGGYKQYDEGDD